MFNIISHDVEVTCLIPRSHLPILESQATNEHIHVLSVCGLMWYSLLCVVVECLRCNLVLFTFGQDVDFTGGWWGRVKGRGGMDIRDLSFLNIQ